jgi:hypothetical protein
MRIYLKAKLTFVFSSLSNIEFFIDDLHIFNKNNGLSLIQINDSLMKSNGK